MSITLTFGCFGLGFIFQMTLISLIWFFINLGISKWFWCIIWKIWAELSIQCDRLRIKTISKKRNANNNKKTQYAHTHNNWCEPNKCNTATEDMSLHGFNCESTIDSVCMCGREDYPNSLTAFIQIYIFDSLWKVITAIFLCCAKDILLLYLLRLLLLYLNGLK